VEVIGGGHRSTQDDNSGYEMIGAAEELIELKGVVTMRVTFMAHIGRLIGNARFTSRLPESLDRRERPAPSGYRFQMGSRPSALLRGMSASVSVIDDGFRFDLDLPAWVEERGNDDHGAGRADLAEEGAVRSPDGIAIARVCQILARADNVFRPGAGFGKRRDDDLKTPGRLRFGIRIAGAVRPDRRRTGDNHAIADSHGAAESNSFLER
jgi:hypothetical protein